MNVFLRELKANRNSLIYWSLGMLFLVATGMAKYKFYSTGGQSLNTIIDQMPHSVQLIFGISGFDLSKASGFYGLLFIYIALMGGVHAVLLGANILSKEERDKTVEFLLVKPMSRARLLTAKLLAGLVNVIILNLVTLWSSVYFVAFFSKNQSTNHEIYLLMAALLFLQLLFYVIGLAIAAVTRRAKTVPSIGTAILLVTYILSFMVNINSSLDNLKYITPFSYFDAQSIIANNRLDPVYVSITAVLIVVLLVVTYSTFSKRDVSL